MPCKPQVKSLIDCFPLQEYSITNILHDHKRKTSENIYKFHPLISIQSRKRLIQKEKIKKNHNIIYF